MTYLVVVVVSALGETFTELLGVLGAARTLGALAGALSVGVGLILVGGRDLMRLVSLYSQNADTSTREAEASSRGLASVYNKVTYSNAVSLAVDVGSRALGNALVDSAGGSRLSSSRGLGSSAGEDGERAGDDGSRETHLD